MTLRSFSKKVLVLLMSATILLAPKLAFAACQWTQTKLPDQVYSVVSSRVLSENDVWALANAVSAAPQQVIHWDGTVWALVSIPMAPAGVQYQFYSISGSADTDIWLVGASTSNGSTDPLTFHFDGGAWQLEPGPRPTRSGCVVGGGVANAVFSFSLSDVWTVGGFCTALPGGKQDYQVFAARWTGAAWKVVASQDNDTRNAGLGVFTQNNVSASSENDIWGASDTYNVLIFWHFDGSHWTRVPELNNRVRMQGVYVDSPTDAWAVGYENARYPSQLERTYTLHWDGSAWTRVPSFNEDTQTMRLNNWLFSVTGSGPNDVWAVGAYGLHNKYLAIHWNGSGWTDVSPDGMGGYGNLVQQVGPLDFWSFGLGGSLPAAYHVHCNNSTIVPR